MAIKQTFKRFFKKAHKSSYTLRKDKARDAGFLMGKPHWLDTRMDKITRHHNNFFKKIGFETRVHYPHKGLIATTVGVAGGIGYGAYKGVKSLMNKRKR